MIYFKYKKDDIPKELIEECENKAHEENEIYFIFDNEITSYVRSHNSNKSERRDMAISSIFGEDIFYVGSKYEFSMLPSRYSYYDTETKSADRYERHRIAVNFVKSLGFESTQFNYGLEYEQSYTLVNKIDNEHWILRITSNLHIKIKQISPIISEDIYDEFFDRTKIIDILKDSNFAFFRVIMRDRKINEIFE